MENYELMLVLEGQIPEDLVREVINKVHKSIKEAGGNVTLEDFWGRRKLAYKIGNQEHGFYDVLNFQLPGESIKKIENDIKLIGEVIRYLVIKKQEKTLKKPKELKKKELSEAKKEEKAEPEEETEKEKEALPEVQPSLEEAQSKVDESEKIEEEKAEPEEKKDKEEKTKKKQKKEELEELDKKLDEILKE